MVRVDLKTKESTQLNSTQLKKTAAAASAGGASKHQKKRRRRRRRRQYHRPRLLLQQDLTYSLYSLLREYLPIYLQHHHHKNLTPTFHTFDTTLKANK